MRYDCQYRLPDGTICHADHAYNEHIRSLPVAEQFATHNMDGTSILLSPFARRVQGNKRASVRF